MAYEKKWAAQERYNNSHREELREKGRQSYKEHYHLTKDRKNKLRRKNYKKWILTHREKERERLRKWRREHRESESQRNKEYYWENHEKELKRCESYRKRNKEKTRKRGLKYYWENYDKEKKRSNTYYLVVKFKALQIISGHRIPQCIICGEKDIRVLTKHHKRKLPNNGIKKERRRLDIRVVKGDRKTDDLEVRCYNCNAIYEYERGRKSGVQELRKRALYALSNGKKIKCMNCSKIDKRILNINHIGGLNGKERGQASVIYRKIISGKKKGFDIRCYNCNKIHEYERGRLSFDKKEFEKIFKEKKIIRQSDSL